jgi:putative transposase
VAKVLHAAWQSDPIHALRNLLAHVGPAQRAMATGHHPHGVHPGGARRQWARSPTASARFARLARAMDEAADDVLAYMTFHPDHWARNQLDQPAGAPDRRDQTPHRTS